MSTLPSIVELEQAAGAAQRSEIAFRQEVANEVHRHERERQFAFRRVELAKSMARAAAECETRDAAVASQISAFKSEFGWYGENDQRRRICAAWEAVADAIWREAKAAAGDDNKEALATVVQAMLAFEAWYGDEFGRPFLELLDHEIPEMPVVEI